MQATMPGTETIRLRRPDAVTTPKKLRHTGLLQDKVRRTAKGPWSPGFSVALRMFIFVRFCAAMYSNIQDCDEVYNFWEPLHYLDHGVGFQTWETSPAYAIRSWAYVLLHLGPARFVTSVMGLQSRNSFFGVRIVLSFITSYCESRFYRAVADKMNERLGRYLLFIMLFSTGMWNASTAFLPSTFAMYANLIGFSYAFRQSSGDDHLRTLAAVVSFAVGAIVGWPFSLLLAVPFVFEEFFIYGADRVSSAVYGEWLSGRIRRFITSCVIASFVFIPVILVDSWAYGKWVIVPWNIIKYNVFPSGARGPDLYGTEPWYFYILNLSLNFNIALPLALISLPALMITHSIDYTRLGFVKHDKETSSPYTLMFVRLAPLYLWLGTLSLQAHKEERFMYPAYPLVCFNAATSVYFIRGWCEVAYIKITSSPYAASQTKLFKRVTRFIVLTSIFLSCSRIVALNHYYHAPLDISFHFNAVELPRLLNATDLLPPPPPRLPSHNIAYDSEGPPVDLTPIKQFDLKLCFGKEWYRFPGHYLVPHHVQVEFVKSEFDGLLPRHFERSRGDAGGRWKREMTRAIPEDLNDLNEEVTSRYVDPSACHYLVDLDFSHNPIESKHEPRYAVDEKTWDRAFCVPFLDARHSSLLTRTLYIPLESWEAKNSYGDYCLLRNKKLIGEIEHTVWKKD